MFYQNSLFSFHTASDENLRILKTIEEGIQMFLPWTFMHT